MLTKERSINHTQHSIKTKTGTKNKDSEYKIESMVDINPIISIIILSINNLNTSKTEIIRMDQKMTQLYAIYKKPTLSLFF